MKRRNFLAGTLALFGAWKLKLPWGSSATAAKSQVWVWQSDPGLPQALKPYLTGVSEWMPHVFTYEFTLTKTPDGANLIETKWVESEKTPPPPDQENASSAKDIKAHITVVSQAMDPQSPSS